LYLRFTSVDVTVFLFSSIIIPPQIKTESYNLIVFSANPIDIFNVTILYKRPLSHYPPYEF